MKVRIAFIVLSVIGFALMMPFVSYAESIEDQKSRLESELAQIEKEIQAQEKLLEKQRAQSGSITRDLNVIRSEIKQKRLEIEKKTRLINGLVEDIREKNNAIKSLGSELTREKEALSKIIRNSYEIENTTLVEILLSGESLSTIIGDLDDYQTIQSSLQDSVETIQRLKERTDIERKKLEEKQIEEANVKYALEVDEAKVQVKQTEQERLLVASKTQEKSYEQVIAEKKAEYNRVYGELFKIVGVESGSLEFGQAYELAKQAGNKTGVDPAFILAILKQETNIGKNIGTCNRVGDSRTWRTIMPGPNDNSWRDDQTIFLAITKVLGINPEGQPLSCPLASGGWGGAMGISQFIPATWASYGGFVEEGGQWVYDKSKDRIRQALGSSTVSSPWNHLHGITATALYVKDLGAGAKTYTAEREAACKYYSGRSCTAPNVRNAFYGDAVMAHKIAIQKNIDVLEEGY